MSGFYPASLDPSMGQTNLSRIRYLKKHFPKELDLVRVINYIWEITDPWKRVNRVCMVPANQILIAPFSKDRAEDCIARTRAGERMPPIDCQRIVVGPFTFYTVNDGQHRVLACRTLGIERVPAKVASSLVADTTRLVVTDDGLWRQVKERKNAPLGMMTLVEWKTRLPEDQWNALMWLVEAGKLKPVTLKAKLTVAGTDTGSIDPSVVTCGVCGTPLYGDMHYNSTEAGGHASCVQQDGSIPIRMEFYGLQ